MKKGREEGRKEKRKIGVSKLVFYAHSTSKVRVSKLVFNAHSTSAIMSGRRKVGSDEER